jgi:RecJ-like exonuclease
MAYGSMFLNMNKPILAFTESEDNFLKGSGRGNYDLVNKGLHLGNAMEEACKKVGGEGGGHNVAAGARIPKDKEKEFITIIEEIIKKQLNLT